MIKHTTPQLFKLLRGFHLNNHRVDSKDYSEKFTYKHGEICISLTFDASGYLTDIERHHWGCNGIHYSQVELAMQYRLKEIK